MLQAAYEGPTPERCTSAFARVGGGVKSSIALLLARVIRNAMRRAANRVSR